jgi:DNA-binding MltR family transcriptional regulator
MHELEKESDRGCALAASSYLEDRLQQLLRTRMVDHPMIDELFKGTDALSTFSARIKLAFALGIISNEVRLDLDAIRDIRNNFGHVLELQDFTHTEVNRVCSHFHNLINNLLVVEQLSPPRLQFVKCVMALEVILDSSFDFRPHANRQAEVDALQNLDDSLKD